METSSRNLYHICEFAEIAENRGATVTPLSSVMQKGERTPIASWNRAYSGKAEDIPAQFKLPVPVSEELKSKVVAAMRTAGYEFNKLESDFGCLRFNGEQQIVFGSWKEASEWLDNALVDDTELAGKVERVMHPERESKLTVLMVEPKKEPYIKEISPGLESLQKEVGGYIEAVYPFEDPVALICNEEGKLEGLPLNRGLFDDEGHLYDIVSGNMLVVGLTDDNFGSLSPELLEKYMVMYKEPQTFIQINGMTTAVPIISAGKEESDTLAHEIVSLFSNHGFEPYQGASADQLAHTEEAISHMIRAGEDFQIREALLQIAEGRSSLSKSALEQVKALDSFYLSQGTPRFLLYQLDFGNDQVRDFCYRSYDEIKKDGLSVDGYNYSCVYSGRLGANDTLDSIYERFNLHKPFSYTGHSLSVSDVILISRDGNQQAFYVDSFGFKEIPEFFHHNPLEKIEELLEDDYGMIDGVLNNGRKETDLSNAKASVRDKLNEKKKESKVREVDGKPNIKRLNRAEEAR